jgi:hypothetical protein
VEEEAVSQGAPSDPQKPGEQARYTVNIIDRERLHIRSNENIKTDTAYKALEDLQSLIWMEDDICSADGGRWSLAEAFRMARLAVGLCDFLEVEFQWSQNSKVPPASVGESGQPSVIVNTSPPAAQIIQERPGIRQAIGGGISSLFAARVVEMEKKAYPMQRLREARDPLEVARALRTAGLEFDKWFWAKVVPYYDTFVEGNPAPDSIIYECNSQVKAALQQWVDAAMGSVKSADHFLNQRNMDLEHNVARAEAVALAAERGAPKPQETPRPSI